MLQLLIEQLVSHPFVSAVFALAIAICLAACVWIVVRWAPYQPRRAVPWNAMDLVLIVAVYLSLQVGIVGLAGMIAGQDVVTTAQSYGSEQSTTAHVVGQLIAEGNLWVFLLCGVSAVLVAPAVEEFFFRVLLQGWLEAVEHRWRRRMPTLRRLIPVGGVPIVLASLLFARLHFRVETPQLSALVLILLLAGDAVARIVTLLFAVCFLRWHAGATAADLGWTPGKFRGDIGLGLGVFLAVAVPIYAMQIGLQFMLPPYIAPDPFPLFFFALALGVLYYRTHRIMPAVMMHAFLNGTSLAMVWLGS